MYSNLKAEMARKNITIKLLSEMTNIPYTTLQSKIKGLREFTINEGLIIKNALGVDLPLDFLFIKEEI